MLGCRNSGSDLSWRAALGSCCIRGQPALQLLVTLCSHQQKLFIFGCWQILKAYPELHELLMEIAVPKALVVIHPGNVPLPSE